MDTVSFDLPGINKAVAGQSYDAPAAEESSPLVTVQSSKYMPLMMIVLLVGGYFGLRWIMED